MEKSKSVKSEPVSAHLKRQVEYEDEPKIEKKKRKMKRERTLTSYKENDIIESHDLIRDYDPSGMVEYRGSGSWEVELPFDRYLEKCAVSHTVKRKIKGDCGWGWRCDEFCPSCDKCIHQFECDCEGGKAGNMCEHIHLVCQGPDSEDERSSEDSSESEDESDDSKATSSESDDDDDENDERKASDFTSKMDVLIYKARNLAMGKKNADILIQNLKSAIALFKKNEKQDDNN